MAKNFSDKRLQTEHLESPVLRVGLGERNFTWKKKKRSKVSILQGVIVLNFRLVVVSISTTCNLPGDYIDLYAYDIFSYAH